MAVHTTRSDAKVLDADKAGTSRRCQNSSIGENAL